MDNFDRLPEIAQKKYLGNDYNRYLTATYSEKEQIRKNRPTNAKNNLCSLFRNALEKSINRAEWNYRTGVPMYYIREDEMTILLPIAFAYEFTLSDNWENESDDLPCDLALAMQLQTIGENQKYVARTIFTLDMAYRDARLITRPSSDWLSAELIDSIMEDDE